VNASYRLQLTPEFTFEDVRRLLPYFRKLGVSHLYLSPITEARLGSTHGYDVIDHNRVREAFGGRAGLEQLMQEAQQHGLRFILDFVPNHAGVGPRNALWQDVLAYGPHSPHAGLFDIDWNPLKPELKNKVLLPFLGAPYGQVIDEGGFGLTYADGRFYLTYFENRFALSPATYPVILEKLLPLFERTDVYFDLKDLLEAYEDLEPHEVEKAEGLRVRLTALAERLEVRELPTLTPQAMHALLERQFFRLAHWQTAGFEINYRRFFDINELVALHMENPEVFWASHKLLGELATLEALEGVRIDHIDGLFDPQGYLEGLKDLGIKKAWVEKILASGEVLPGSWFTAGTSGYEFMNDVVGVLTHPGGEEALLRSYRRLMGTVKPYADEVHDAKRLVMDTSLAGELARLANELDRLSEADYRTRDFTLPSLQEALAEVIAAFPRYRTYLPHDPEEAAKIITEAVETAKRRNPATELSVYDFIQRCLLEPGPEALEGARRAFVGRFQQYTAPVTAKGIEDTTFYRYVPYIARNEVGGEPEHFATPLHAFHAHARFRAFRYPENLLATATHDHKRGEDTRMRLVVLSELPERWEETVLKLHERAQALRRARATAPFTGSSAPGSDLYLLYQTLVALWPGTDAHPNEREALTERLLTYMEKAMREAKLHTSWLNQNAEYEEEMRTLVRELMHDPEAAAIIAPFAAEVARLGFHNTLAQTILKLTTPGVPDFYQGTELLDLSLVDPDNRRPVDYGTRSAMIDALQPHLAAPDADAFRGWMAAQDPRAKLFLSAFLLRARAQHPELFSGSYRELEASGAGAEHLIAYAREGGGEALVVLVTRFPGHAEKRDLSSVSVTLPEGLAERSWLELLSSKRLEGGTLTLGDLPLPFGVLLSQP
jgi:(1->4)-alpha-D-glucan 1-alpha-D-glucosylmutase